MFSTRSAWLLFPLLLPHDTLTLPTAKAVGSVKIDIMHFRALVVIWRVSWICDNLAVEHLPVIQQKMDVLTVHCDGVAGGDLTGDDMTAIHYLYRVLDDPALGPGDEGGCEGDVHN